MGGETREGNEDGIRKETGGSRAKAKGRSEGRREKVQAARMGAWMEDIRSQASSPAHFAGLVPASILCIRGAALTVPPLQEDRGEGEA